MQDPAGGESTKQVVLKNCQAEVDAFHSLVVAFRDASGNQMLAFNAASISERDEWLRAFMS